MDTETIRINSSFLYNAGLFPKIIRKSSGHCCKWCNEVAGVYEYLDVPKDVYRRHKNCDCTVDYYSGTGRKQNVHTKTWTEDNRSARIEARKNVGLKINDDAIQRDIRENVIPEQKIDTIVNRQDIHRQGTELYEERQKILAEKGEFGPSYITISDEEVLELVSEFSSKGEIKYNKLGDWNNQEVIVTNEKIIGVVIDNRNGKGVETSVFKIYYGKDGIHIVPDYPRKKEAKMKYEELKDKIGKFVVLTDIDGGIFRGKLTNTEPDFQTESGKEEVEIYIENYWVGIPLDEIKSIIEIE